MMLKAKKYSDNLIKPLKSLGVLEDISVQLSGIFGKINNSIKNPSILVLCADNGVYEEGVALTPQNVSALQAVNTVRGKTGIAVLAKSCGCSVKVYDVGLICDTSHKDIVTAKTRNSTNNIVKTDAFVVSDALAAINVGFHAVKELVQSGTNVIGIGEIGIGNTTTSAAIVSLYTGYEPEQIVGKGAGLSNSAYAHKIQVVKTALKRSKPEKAKPLEVLCKVGGLDIAAMTGAFLGCAYFQIPAVIDGFISAAAAILAHGFNPLCRDYMFASHASLENGYAAAMEHLQLKPFLNLNMRLGEGSGCPLAISIMKNACDIFAHMGNFDDDLSEVTSAYLKTVDEKEQFEYLK